MGTDNKMEKVKISRSANNEHLQEMFCRKMKIHLCQRFFQVRKNWHSKNLKNQSFAHKTIIFQQNPLKISRKCGIYILFYMHLSKCAIRDEIFDKNSILPKFDSKIVMAIS